MRCRGSSTSAAATFRTRRWCSRSRWCRKDARPTIYVDLRKLGNESRARLEDIADVRPNAAFERDLAALGEHQAGAARSLRVPRGDRADCHGERRRSAARQRSDRADEGDQERHRNRRRPRGAAARRRGGDALSRLVRPRGAARRTDRDRRGRGDGELFAARPVCSRTSRSRPSPAPDRTAPSCITASPAKATAASRRTNCF